MKLLLKLEFLALFILFSYLLFLQVNNALALILLLFLPDIGMIGYALNPKIGSVTYNLTHHLTVGVIALLTGFLLANPGFVIVGYTILAHSNIDRFLGFGLKYQDNFKNTHLGKI